MTKRTVLATSTIATVLFFVFMYATEIGLCTQDSTYCWRDFQIAGFFLVIFIPIFLFSIITYFTPQRAFKSWIRFTQWYVPIFWIANAYVTYKVAHRGSGLIGTLNAALAGDLFLLVLAIFMIVSIVIIILKSFPTPRG